jgi:hypothetical protein
VADDGAGNPLIGDHDNENENISRVRIVQG